MREMKYSGVEWMEDIPASWNMIRFKDKYQSIKEIAGESSSEYERLALTLGGVIKRPKDDSEGLQPKAFDGYQILRENDFVFKMIDLQNVSTSRVGLSPYTGLVSPAYIRFCSKNKNQFNKFVYYYLMSMYYNCVFNSLGGDGVRSALNASDMGMLMIPFPSEHEQMLIVEAIESQTDKVDALIANQEAQIVKLKAYKQSIITEVVTKGLDPNVPMKDSGVEWIGKIPQSWYVIKNRNIFRNKTVKGHGDATVLSVYRDWGVVPKDSRDDNWNVTSLDTDSYKYIEPGDLVINKMKAWSGSLSISDYAGIVSPAYYTCTVNYSIVDQRFIHHYLRNKKLVSMYEMYSAGMRIGQWDLSIDDFLGIEVAIPQSKEEQKLIADYLDKKCDKVDKLIFIKQQKIEKLNQYKKSLIYEYVTGKKEVM